MKLRSAIGSLVCLVALVAAGFAQAPAPLAGALDVRKFGKWVSQATSAVAATSATMTIAPCYFPVDGASSNFFPLSTNMRVTITDSTLTETVTPTAVTTPVQASGSSFPGGFSCTFTATFANAHAVGVQVSTGDGGIGEAAAALTSGILLLANGFASDTVMASVPVGNANVSIVDYTGPTERYFTVQPSTLTALATPATRSATADATQVISGTAVGTWPASAEFVCVTYVDILGGESPCSASFSFTATLNVALNFAAPAASTGAVGWRAYAGLSSLSTAYQLPISAATCTLSKFTPYPTCAMGAAGVFPTPTTTTALAPGYVVAVYRPNTQSHTTFAYQPSANPGPSCGASIQTDFGPFIATAGGTTGQVQVLGTVPLPSACLNYIGKTIRVHGKITGTFGASETPSITVSLGPSFTTGTPTAICAMSHTTALSAVVYGARFECTMTTNATGASGTVMPDGFAMFQIGAGTTIGNLAVDTGTAAITDSLSGVDNIYVIYKGTSGTSTAVQLLDLHLEEL